MCLKIGINAYSKRPSRGHCRSGFHDEILLQAHCWSDASVPQPQCQVVHTYVLVLTPSFAVVLWSAGCSMNVVKNMCIETTVVPSVFWYCWLGKGKGVGLVKIYTSYSSSWTPTNMESCQKTTECVCFMETLLDWLINSLWVTLSFTTAKIWDKKSNLCKLWSDAKLWSKTKFYDQTYHLD